MKNFFRVFIVIFVLLFIFNYATAMGRQPSKKASLDKEAPDFSLSDIDGDKVTLSDFKNKNNVMLFFWATWCRFCQKEISYLNTKYDELKEKEMVVLAIDINENINTVKKFLANKPTQYSMLLDKDANVSSDYDIIGVPTYILIDKEGIVKFMGNNFPEDYGEFISE